LTTATAGTARTGGFLSGLWNRQLDTYPETGPRFVYLGITVLATIMLYYELYVGGSVSTLLLPDLHMSFNFFVYATAIGNLLGAFGSLFAGITDRLGRTNLVVVGLIIAAVFVEWVIPASTSKWEFVIFTFIVGIIEGICLVATPALIRDFSPQVGRASAMGFWTSGPVVGSLIVAVVATNTIGLNPHNSFWTHEYHICGVAGLVVAAIALVGLKELSPGLRDQLMVTMRDRALIEAKAKGIDIEATLRHPWRQLIKPDVLISATGISVFLVIYYTFVGFGLLYYATVFGFSTKNANGLLNWSWGFNVIAVVLIGFFSDAVRVRKPFMIVGAIGAAVLTVVYLSQAGHHPGYYTLAGLAAALSFCLGVAYVPWMASFTETVEAHNPALTATGLAIWGWVIRVIVFASIMILPSVINTMNPLVTYGTTVAAADAKYGPEVAFAETHPAVVATATKIAPELQAIAAHPTLFAQLAANPTPALISQAEATVGPALFAKIAADQAQIKSVLPYASQLSALAAAAKDPSFQVLEKHGAQVAAAAKANPGKWKDWYWVCFGCMIFFLLTVPLMRGRWSPKKARQDEEAHEAMIQAEMAKLGITANA
jgi:MFS family permease